MPQGGPSFDLLHYYPMTLGCNERVFGILQEYGRPQLVWLEEHVRMQMV